MWIMGKCGSLAGHLVISPCDYEIEHEWQSWTCSPERAPVSICSARPLCLSHCHCQLPHWGWLERPLVLLQISLSPAKTCFPNKVVIPFQTCRHLHPTLTLTSPPVPLSPFQHPLKHSILVAITTFWTLCLLVFPLLVANPRYKTWH